MELVKKLAETRIEARPVWKPMHRQPLFAGCEYWPHHESESVSDGLFQHGICFPSGSNLTIEAQRRVIDRTIEILDSGIRSSISNPASRAG